MHKFNADLKNYFEFSSVKQRHAIIILKSIMISLDPLKVKGLLKLPKLKFCINIYQLQIVLSVLGLILLVALKNPCMYHYQKVNIIKKLNPRIGCVSLFCATPYEATCEH